MNINFTQPVGAVTAYQMLNISFELAERIYFFEAFSQKEPELRIMVTERFKTISKGSFSFRRKLLKAP